MKIMVTGGAGMVGSNLVRMLKQKYPDSHITVMDNLCTGRRKNLGAEDFFMEGDVSDRLTWDAAHRALQMGKSSWDYVYHLACPASPPAYQRLPFETMMANTDGLKLAIEYGKTTLFASTSEVYGDPNCKVQRETYWGNVNSFGPRACYDESKRMGEAICYEYIKRSHDVKVARIFNSYGPFMDPNDGRVISNFICQMLRDQDVTIYGDGRQTRSFCYVEDTCRGLIALAESEVRTPVNIGNPKEFTMLELHRILCNILGDFYTRKSHPLPVDDPRQRKPDILKAKRLLNWQPKVGLEEGLKLTIAYFKEELK